ncbi:malto-oligosyltrehalose trehalohydrolase [Spirosoma fluviale]|uniref:Malto-oligosyltrehalose trehalohydrolase n=1 Tax=Spirosoma fluviale TaxID=1597977 RepID=A0A286F7Z2_9BACT|nr:malto-oligosyltrehalose trehalohydrolase [Spirosoma fluviale]SOD79347.1 maltooligosyltrehalose trehalohydrolase [Spirosoma fluviale]
MHQLNVNRRSLGISFPNKPEAEVTVWAPKATQVVLKVYNKSATLPLVSAEIGYWHLTTDQIKPGDQYTFVLNGDEEFADPASLYQPKGVDGPSQAVDTAAYYWEDQSWINPSLDSYLIYEIHIGSFTGAGTFKALEAKLDYLKALGVTAIEIMPISQFPDSRNWGYDGVYSFAVQNSYGGVLGLQHLVNICHYKGIAVILDVVYNHFGPEGNHMENFGPYLTDKYRTPWGKGINFDDLWCDGVRRHFIENALMWFRDFHIDALRLDAVHALKDSSPVHILQELRQRVDDLMRTTGRRHYLLVECDLNDPRYLKPLAEQGYGMDAQWIDEFHHSLRVAVGQEKTGYYADFNGLNHLAKSYKDGYVYDGQFSVVREKLFGQMAHGNAGEQFIVFSQNHDQIGNRKQGERSSQLYSYEMLKLMAGAVLVSPFIPLLFMGEEWGETNPFFYFVNYTEADLAEAVRQGRKDEFDGDDDVPDPQTKETFEHTKLQWHLPMQEPHRTLLRYYQTLIALRHHLPALYHLDRNQLDVAVDTEKELLTLHRWHEDQHVLCLMNFSEQPQSTILCVSGEDIRWEKLLDSADAQWQPNMPSANSACPALLNNGDTISLQPESFILYAQHHEKSRFHIPDPIPQRFYVS